MTNDIWEKNRLTEADAPTHSDNAVAVYVGTYGKYNDGSIDGKWMYPADYDTLDDFIDACMELHSDEEDPELMFQDAENLPDSLYSESDFSEEAFDFAKWIDDNDDKADAAVAYINLFGDWDEDDFEDRYRGDFDSDEDFCWDFIDACGGVKEALGEDLSNYFDYEHFGRELAWDMSEDDETDAYYLEMSDYDRGENYINDVYGDVSEVGEQTLEDYFDISAYARDVMMTDVCEEDGHYFWSN